MDNIFQFKQFWVDQENCTIKVNTDGVLLGATASAENPKTILDIGTGTGVIALMLAQRFPEAKIDAVEIDATSGKTAGSNFNNSAFANRLTLHPMAIQNFWLQKQHQQYDLVVSNPPFYLDTLISPKENKTLAKHAVPGFFEDLMNETPKHLSAGGKFWLILPLKTTLLLKGLAATNLFLQEEIAVSSFPNQAPHRYLLCFGLKKNNLQQSTLNIYESEKKYSAAYQTLLKDFLMIF